MKERSANNVHTAFVGEAKAYQRLLMFAANAEKEDLPQIAHLFRVIAAAEAIHSRRHFALLESVADTQTNLEQAFQSETTVNKLQYTKMLQEAEEDGEKAAAIVFSQTHDVEDSHVKLYKKALDHLIAERFTEYYICTICGYTVERKSPKRCPVCNAPNSKFKKID
jgi:rubrerythrin